MQEEHWKAAGQHELAAQCHRIAAAHKATCANLRSEAPRHIEVRRVPEVKEHEAHASGPI